MKRTVVRRTLALVLTLVMALSAVPFGVLAEGAEGTVTENLEAPAPEGSPAGDQETPEPPETPVTPENPENKETPEGKAETPEKPEEKTEEPEGKTGEAQKTENAPATQEGANVPIDQKENQEGDTLKCVCDENGAKCTEEKHNEDCPACSKADADYEKCCNGKMTAEAEDKRTAEEEAAEEAAKKTAEEEAAKKAAEEAAKKAAEEAAQKASKEAVKNVQEKIDALPAADTITAENREEVKEALTAIDDAKEKLTDEEREKLDFTNYKAAADALSALEGMPGAEVPKTLEEAGTGNNNARTAILKLMVSVRKKDMTTVLADNGSVTLIKEGEAQGDIKDIAPTTGAVLFENLEAGTYQLSAKVTVNGIERTTENTVVISQEDLGVTKEVPVTVIEPKVTISTTIEGDMPICSSSDLSISGLENLEAELEKVENTDVTIAIQVNISGAFASSPDLIYGCRIVASWNRIVEGNEESVTADEWNLLQKKGCWLVVPMRTSGYKFDVTNDGKSFAVDGYTLSQGDIVEDTNGEAQTVFQRNENSLGIRLITFTDVWAFRIMAIQSRTARIKFNGNGDGAQVTKESIGVARFQEGEQWYCSLLDSRICASRPGYVFQGWATTPDTAQSNVTKNSLIPIDGGEVTLYAVWTTAPRTITFDSNGGTACDPAETSQSGDGTLDSLPTSTKPGYTFDGWYRTVDGEPEKVTTETVFTENTTVYAKWTPVTYTVTFHSNYGDTDTTATQDFTYDVPQALNCGSGITRNYYKISGWAESADGEKKYEANETVKNLGTQSKEGFLGKDLYALWEYVPYTVTFDAQGVNEDGQATNGTVTENGQKKPTVERKTQENPINTLKTLPVPDAQENYYFEGWYYKDRTNKEQPVEIGKTVFSADTRVYAKWKTFEPVTVTLKCQRGTMTLGGKTVSEGTMQTKWPGVVDGTLPTPARTGYKFQGWYTAAGVKVDQDTIYLRDTTIYARWTSAVSRTGNPKTGDQIALEAAVAVLVLAAVGLGVAVVVKKKKGK